MHACRQRTAKVSLGRINVHGGVSAQQGAAFRDRPAVSVQSATWDGARSATSSESSAPTPSCKSRRTPKILNSRQWKDYWWGTVTTARATECTIRPPGALWRAGTSCSSRHHRTYSRHRVGRNFAADYSAKQRHGRPELHHRRRISAQSSRLHFRVETSRSARSPEGTHWTVELQDH